MLSFLFAVLTVVMPLPSASGADSTARMDPPAPDADGGPFCIPYIGCF